MRAGRDGLSGCVCMQAAPQQQPAHVKRAPWLLLHDMLSEGGAYCTQRSTVSTACCCWAPTQAAYTSPGSVRSTHSPCVTGARGRRLEAALSRTHQEAWARELVPGWGTAAAAGQQRTKQQDTMQGFGWVDEGMSRGVVLLGHSIRDAGKIAGPRVSGR